MGRNAYFRMMYALYWAALVVCGGCRIYLILFNLDTGTGFYQKGSALIPVLNYTLLAAVLVMMLSSRLRRVDNDFPIIHEGRAVGALALLAGVALALFALENSGWFAPTGQVGTPLAGAAAILCGVLGLLAALAFLWMGLCGIIDGYDVSGSMIALFPSLWQLVLLVVKFNSYTTVTTIMDNLLIVTFMVANAVFLIGHARTTCGLIRKNGRNYMLPTGLITSLLGLLLVVPNYVYMAARRTLAMPSQSLGHMESLFVLLISIYAFGSAVRLRRSIAVV